MASLTNHNRFFVISALIVAVALMRLLPHPPNFSPIAAIALFGGAYLTKKHWAFIIPILAMLASDIALELTTGYGFHALMPVIYVAFAMTVCIGLFIAKRVSFGTVIGGTLAASVLFFVRTNFAVWMTGDLYPRSIEGLIACYVAAIPFFGNTVLGNLLFSGLLFGGWAIAQNKLPMLARPTAA